MSRTSTFFTVVFATIFTTAFCTEHTQAAPNRLIVIDDPVLHLVDGTPAININQIRYFVSRCRELQLGKKTEQGIEGLLEFNGTKKTVKDMVIIEENSDENQAEYKRAFEQAAEYFAKISVPYLEEVSYTKNYLVKLIDRWSKQRGKPQTILLDWANIDGTEVDSLSKSITTFKKLDALISDLTMFLADLIISCPRSFISAFKNPEEGRAILNKIRAQNGCAEQA